MFASDEDYQRAVDADVITQHWISEAYQIPEREIVLVNLAAARAIKFSFPRIKPQGDPGETDMYSGQQYAPLLNLPV